MGTVGGVKANEPSAPSNDRDLHDSELAGAWRAVVAAKDELVAKGDLPIDA